MSSDWQDLGPVAELSRRPLQQVVIGRTRIALSFQDGRFAAISGACNHVGGPLGDGRLDGEYVVCPWHNWKYHRATGRGEPGYEDECVPRYEVEVRGDRLWIDLAGATKRNRLPHAPHPLARTVVRESGPIRVAGISTTGMDLVNPRFSTSEALLEVALEHAREQGAETRLIRLAELQFRHCEGYYSKSAHACTWPCSITQMDPNDQLDRVYEAMVHWADVLMLATPIRWGAASSLYFKMAERLNCVQNQTTIRNRVLIKNKVATFIVTGGQDNVQGVVGQLLTFFGELGFVFPQFPFIAHSRGWSAEDMENNIKEVRNSLDLREGARQLVDRGIRAARDLLDRMPTVDTVAHGGRKAQPLMK
jgi:multimeric flavodoxin WrbA/nitrite reductase/ring-hydroxylating ferredoxin subunit